MKILIRTDSSMRIGSGHLMRCLTLAEGLREKGGLVCFACRDLHGNLNHFIKERGFQLHVLPAPGKDFRPAPEDTGHAAWLEVSWPDDLEETKAAVSPIAERFDWIIVDSYALDHRWEAGMRGMTDRVMVIDDLADRVHDCDLLLDQNFFGNAEKRYNKLIPKHCRRMLGPGFSLLRPEFGRAREFAGMRGDDIARVLVYFGGNDNEDMTGKTLEALSCTEFEHIILDVVVGPNYSYLDGLNRQAANRSKTRVHVQPAGFTELMLRSDLCIGAGGSTAWERLCLMLPTIVITTAANQETPASELNKAGLVDWIGTKDTVSREKIKTAVRNMMLASKGCDPEPSGILVDGFGSNRISEILLPSPKESIALRPARMEDMGRYFIWVNDPVSRKLAFNSGVISWKTHQSWFRQKLASNRTLLLVLETHLGLPVGQIRFDIQEDHAEIDYSLDPIVRGRGWASRLLTLGIELFKSQNEDIPVSARVKNLNKPSCAAFRRIARSEEVVDPDVTVFHLT